MSGSRVRLFGSTSGYVELAAPAVAPDAVLTLPSTFAGVGSNVVQTVKTDTFTSTAASWEDVTGLAATISMSTTSSRLLAILSITAISDNVTNASSAGIRLTDGTNTSPVGGADGSRLQFSSVVSRGVQSDDTRSTTLQWFYTPGTTSPVTLTAQVFRGGTAGTVLVNRGVTDTNSASGSRSVSTLTLIEVAA
jgi:hypothetical protein